MSQYKIRHTDEPLHQTAVDVLRAGWSKKVISILALLLNKNPANFEMYNSNFSNNTNVNHKVNVPKLGT